MDQSVRPYHLDDEAIESISSTLADSRVTVPTYLDHAPRRIDNHHNQAVLGKRPIDQTAKNTMERKGSKKSPATAGGEEMEDELRRGLIGAQAEGHQSDGGFNRIWKLWDAHEKSCISG
jgi:hypothetical protein